ncbi:alpha/beta fold hydrolase [Ruania halotolerans]|uniref:alpha/beta fold hydrolase n=1 Tax=Ruania halotolerans TaxID=2897773 RepID=UPI001E315B63|nr:alpha/beta fold hydrolase [Ruania halotolerans]UFU07402.1 alpha/beta fold hydrolase [Ruania halotolerans]
MNIILLPGLWLPRAIWDETAAELRVLGHEPITPILPGVDDGVATVSLDDQVAAVLDAVDAALDPVVVGHSAAASLAWIAADRRPEHVARVVLIGGFPATHGSAYADFFPLADGVMPFPGWQPFEGPDAADLDDAARARIAQIAVAVPGAVAQGEVSLTDERRFDVPVTEVCPEFSPEEFRGWIEAGDIPELARVRHLDAVEIASGHWPMVTKPTELAALLAR